MKNKALLSDHLRPKSFADLNLPTKLSSSLGEMIRSSNIMNMIFYGRPGIGKTSTANILIQATQSDAMERDGPYFASNKKAAREIEAFASSKSLVGQPKICLINEANYIPKSAQVSLCRIIEERSDNVRFILTTNEMAGITEALQSRCMPICFDVQTFMIKDTVDRLKLWYQTKLLDIGYELQPDEIYRILSIYYPDLRAVANQLQREIMAQ